MNFVNSRLRVIIFLGNIEGGVTSFVRAFLNYREPEKLWVKLVLVTGDQKGIPFIKSSFKADEFVEFFYSVHENQSHVLSRLRKEVSRPDDIIWVNERMEMSMVNIFRLPNPVICFIHGIGPYYMRTIREYAGISDIIVGVSEWLKEKALEICARENHSTRVVKIFAPVPPIIPNKTVDVFDPIKLLHVGRLEEAKGTHLLPELCKALDEHEVSYTLTIAGSGLLSEWLREQLKDNSKIIWHRQLSQNEIFKLYEDKHIFIFPSLMEAVGLVVVEAMKGGLVPLTFDLESGLPEFVINAESGFRIRKGDIREMALKVMELKESPTFFFELRNNAIRIANELFDATKQAKLIQETIRKIPEKTYTKTFNDFQSASLFDHPWMPNYFSIAYRRSASVLKKVIHNNKH